MSAAAERRALTAYTLYEGLMRAVNAEDPTEAMDIEGSESLTPRLLLGGHEPSKEEEDLWFQERSRCKIFIYSHVPSFIATHRLLTSDRVPPATTIMCILLQQLRRSCLGPLFKLICCTLEDVSVSDCEAI